MDEQLSGRGAVKQDQLVRLLLACQNNIGSLLKIREHEQRSPPLQLLLVYCSSCISPDLTLFCLGSLDAGCNQRCHSLSSYAEGSCEVSRVSYRVCQLLT